MKSFLFALVSLSFLVGSANAELPQRTPPPMKLNDPMPANLFVELGRIINPAVVNISTLAIPRNTGMTRDPMLEMLERFYGGPIQRREQKPHNEKPQPYGLGTGFIIREDGLIVTNNHVIQGADGIQVQLTEKSDKLYDAVVVGFDERTDIALIKIKPDGKLPVAALGSSKDLEVGDWVAAFGNPFGHGHSMTKGIISSKGREIGEINKIPLLQTDASINPGNSGGPLVNTKGYVVGVNSAIDARAQGIGFAIPIDEVKAIIPQLEKTGRIEKGFIGVTLGDLDPSIDYEYLGLPDAGGAVITSVSKGSPAAKAGARPYDIIVDFNGKKIHSAVELTDAVGDVKSGTAATMRVVRDRKPINLKVTVAARPDFSHKKVSSSPKSFKGQKAPFNLGFTVMDLSDEARAQFQIPPDVENPMVVEIERDSKAANAGIRVGDIIVDVNKTEVTKAADVTRLLKAGKNIVRIARGDTILIITINTK